MRIVIALLVLFASPVSAATITYVSDYRAIGTSYSFYTSDSGSFADGVQQTAPVFGQSWSSTSLEFEGATAAAPALVSTLTTTDITLDFAARRSYTWTTYEEIILGDGSIYRGVRSSYHGNQDYAAARIGFMVTDPTRSLWTRDGAQWTQDLVPGTVYLIDESVRSGPDTGPLVVTRSVSVRLVPESACGDGIVQEPEQCDDYNTASGDGCSVACVVEVGFACSGTPSVCAPSAPPASTYTFKTQLPLGTTYGSGSFTFANSLITAPLPKTVTEADLTAFSYSDPVAGSFTLADVGSLNFTLGTTPTTSSFAFIVQSADGLRSLTAGVVDADNVGGLSTANSFAPGGTLTHPYLRFPEGCSSSCVLEPPPTPVCGDGIVQVPEQCDDGDLASGDGCSSMCAIEPPVLTACDDGIDNDGDGLIDYPADPKCLSSADTSEGTITFDSSTAFAAASGPLTTLDFEQAPPENPVSYPNGLDLQGAHFDSTSGGVGWTDYSGGPFDGFLYGAGVTVIPPNYSAYLQVDLPPGTTAVGTNLTGFYVFQVPDRIEVTLSTGEVFQVDSLYISEFFGVVSDTPIDWIRFRITSSSTYTNLDFVHLDNFAFGLAIGTPPFSRPLAFSGELSIEINPWAFTDGPVAPLGPGLATLSSIGSHLTQLAIPPIAAAGYTPISIPVTDPIAFPIAGLAPVTSLKRGIPAANLGETAGGAFGGQIPLRGVAKVCLFGTCSSAVSNISIPLSVVGNGGSAFVQGQVNLTVVGAPWTTGTAAVGTLTHMGSGHGPYTEVSTTAQPGGELNLVTPIFISSNIGSLPLLPTFGRLRLAFFDAPAVGTPICNDAIDNDGDGLIDYPADPGCSSASDDSENRPTPACDDGVDNDGNGLVDYPADPRCSSPSDISEAFDCSDGLDDDGDALIDFPADPGCSGATDESERSASLTCDDGLDNDGDGLTDYPADPGCQNSRFATEAPACADGVDNDGDNGIDWDGGGRGQPDVGCPNAWGLLENPKCQDGIDNNDGDRKIDFDGGASVNGGVALTEPDPQCVGYPGRNTETGSCGLGAELALVMPAILWLRRRRSGVRL